MTSTLMNQDLSLALKQALVKERLTAEPLATLVPDFYKIIKDHISKMEDKKEMEGILNSLILLRQPRILKLADAGAMTDEIWEKMTVEERVYYTTVAEASEKFRDEVACQ